MRNNTFANGLLGLILTSCLIACSGGSDSSGTSANNGAEPRDDVARPAVPEPQRSASQRQPQQVAEAGHHGNTELSQQLSSCLAYQGQIRQVLRDYFLAQRRACWDCIADQGNNASRTPTESRQQTLFNRQGQVVAVLNSQPQRSSLQLAGKQPQQHIDGQLQAAFVSDNAVHVIQNHPLPAPANLFADTFLNQVEAYHDAVTAQDWDHSNQLATHIEADIDRALTDLSMDHFLPRIQQGSNAAQRLLSCTNITAPAGNQKLQLTSISSFNLDDASHTSQGLFAAVDQQHIDGQRLYLVDSQRGNAVAIFQFLLDQTGASYQAQAVFAGLLAQGDAISARHGVLNVLLSGTDLLSSRLLVLGHDGSGTLPLLTEITGLRHATAIDSVTLAGNELQIHTQNEHVATQVLQLADPFNPVAILPH